MNQENVFGAIIVIGVLCFFGWMLWILDDRHPERLAKLRRDLGVPPDNKRD